MITDFPKAIEFVLEQEGGYTLDPNDPGGETKYGISKKAYPNLDIGNLTLEQAKQIYVEDYWKPCRCDELPSPFAIALFDSAVNQGVSTAIRILQKSFGLEQDGIIGSKTITATLGANGRGIKRYLAERLASYSRLMASNNNLLVFAANWYFRVISLFEIILK